jgi:uncharacterized damage-inducible protein DinB
MTDLRYPVGPFTFEGNVTESQRQLWIAHIAEAPVKLRAAVAGLTPEQLDTPYRPEGWTVRQVAHHVPDSHMNAYIRFKLALTEDQPTIKPYDQDQWSGLADVQATPVETSLVLLESLHERWVTLLRSLTATDFARAFLHPEYSRVMTLEETLALYSWHGRHHVAQITSLRERMGW